MMTQERRLTEAIIEQLRSKLPEWLEALPGGGKVEINITPAKNEASIKMPAPVIKVKV